MVKPLFPLDLGLKPKKKRGALNLTEKGLILKSQNYKCKIGHEKITLTTAHFDHKRALGAGGSNQLRNYQALCAKCHDKKTRKDKTIISRKRAKAKKLTFRPATQKQILGKLKQPFF